MTQQNSSNFRLKLAIISVALVIMIEGGIAPALPGMAKQFSNIDISLIQLVATIPGLLVIPASIICGILCKFISRKTLTIFSLILFLITSIAPAFLNSIVLIIILRAFSGATCGFLYVLSATLITEYFTDTKEQNSLQGLKTAVANIGAIVTSTVGGFLAVLNWHVIFWVFAIAFIPLILVALYLPVGKIKESDNTVKENQKDIIAENKQSYKAIAIFSLIGYMLFVLLYFGFVSNYSFIIESEKLGNSAVSGFIYTVFTIGGIVGGVFFSQLERVFSSYIGSFFIGLTAICFWAFATTHSLILFFIMSFVFGITFGVINTLIYTSIGKCVPHSQTNIWFSLIVFFMGLGGFMSSLVLTPIGKALNGASIYRSIFGFTAICFAIGTIIMVIYAILTRSKKLIKE